MSTWIIVGSTRLSIDWFRASLTAALFVGSSALWSQQVPPLLYGTSLPGVVGCAVAVLIGANIFRAIRRSGRIDEFQ